MRFWTFLLATVLVVPGAWGQASDAQDASTPVQEPPISEGVVPPRVPEEEPEAPAEEPRAEGADTNPLTGVEAYMPGSSSLGPSFLFFTFQAHQTVNTNSRVTPGRARMDAATMLLGRIGLKRQRPLSQLSLEYAGGGFLYDTYGRSNLNSPVHRFSISQAIAWRRWSILFGDNLSYLPESSFGFGGFGGLDIFGSDLVGGFSSSLPNLNPVLRPNDSILSSRSSRLMNTGVVQLHYAASSRSSLTAAGSYGVLHFFDSGFINSQFATFMGGYGRALTPKDSLGISYGVNLFHFKAPDTAGSNSFDNHFVYVGYGRRVTGRLAIELSAGPRLARFNRPLSGSANLVSWSTYNSLHYSFPRTSFSATYSHYSSVGSGVLFGAESDYAQVSFGRQLTRKWSGSFSPGYAHNKAFRQTTAGTIRPTFNTWYGRLGFNRPLGRHASIFFSYTLRGQRSPNEFCSGTTCGRVLLGHFGGIGLNWNYGPRKIE